MVSSDPILNSPFGITTISAHSAQSRKISPGSGMAPAGAAGAAGAGPDGAAGGAFCRAVGVRGDWLSEGVAQKTADTATRTFRIRRRNFILIRSLPAWNDRRRSRHCACSLSAQLLIPANIRVNGEAVQSLANDRHVLIY